jgi:hypothetical protein
VVESLIKEGTELVLGLTWRVQGHVGLLKMAVLALQCCVFQSPLPNKAAAITVILMIRRSRGTVCTLFRIITTYGAITLFWHNCCDFQVRILLDKSVTMHQFGSRWIRCYQT